MYKGHGYIQSTISMPLEYHVLLPTKNQVSIEFYHPHLSLSLYLIKIKKADFHLFPLEGIRTKLAL